MFRAYSEEQCKYHQCEYKSFKEKDKGKYILGISSNEHVTFSRQTQKCLWTTITSKYPKREKDKLQSLTEISVFDIF